jgi:pimeloyl-ACP methyl ester carboxylesterase
MKKNQYLHIHSKNLRKSLAFKNLALITVMLTCSMLGHSKTSTDKLITPFEATQVSASNTTEFQIGIMHIEKTGNLNSDKPALIFIPGLACDSQSWENTLPAFEKDHAIYLITFAGFSGKPALAKLNKKPRQLVENALLELIRKENLNKPILIGHSIGATLSTWFSIQYSEKIRAVVAIDGLPVMPFSENMSAPQRTEMAARLLEQMQNVSMQQQAAQQKQYMRTIGVIDEKQADKLAGRSGLSDPKTVAHFMADIFEMDLRSDLNKIQVPVMLVSPYYEEDMKKMKMTEEAKHNYWAKLAQGIPQLSVVGIAGSRHFPMYDQSNVLNTKLKNFLQQF